MGVYAKTALRSFVEVVKKNGKGGVLPCELNGLSVVSVEKEIGEFLREGGRGEMIFEHVGHLVEHGGGGVVVCYGEIEVFVGGYKEEGSVGFVVSQLTRLLGVHGGGKVWLLGVAGTSEAYSKFLRLFPTVDKDWDLHLLTMTSATPSIEKLYPKSRWVGGLVSFSFFFIAFLYSVRCSLQSWSLCVLFILVYFRMRISNGFLDKNNNYDNNNILCEKALVCLDVCVTYFFKVDIQMIRCKVKVLSVVLLSTKT